MPNSGKKMGNNGNNGNNGQSVDRLNRGRKGKHNMIVAKILADLDRLDMETAILVPLDGLNGEKMENVRSALNRATRQKNISVATSTDGKYFYIWRTQAKESRATAPLDRAVHQGRPDPLICGP
jgi:hypothetical protein